MANTHRFIVSIDKDLLPVGHKRAAELGMKIQGKVFPFATYVKFLIESDLENYIKTLSKEEIEQLEKILEGDLVESED